MRIEKGTGGSTVACSFIAMFENLTKSVSHIVCLVWKFSRGGWKTAFLPGNTKWHTNCWSIKNAHFKEFRVLIYNNYNNLLRATWKRRAKIKPKSKHGTKGSWIEPDGHNFLSWIIENSLIVTPDHIQTIELTWWCWKWMSKTVKKLL